MSRLFTGFCFLSLLAVSGMQSAQAGVVVGGTRVIYDSGKKEASIGVKNPEKTAPYLIQSWIEEYPTPTAAKVPFIMTPPLFRLDAGKENIIRIMRTGGNLPEDRESIFWLNIKSIPASTASDKNQLLVSVKTKIKLIYRPALLKDEAQDAYKKVVFNRSGDRLKINNLTSYYISFGTITVGGVEIKEPGMVAPKSMMSLPLGNATGNALTYTTISDFGGFTEIEKRNL